MSEEERDKTEEPLPLPPSIPYFEWQAFATTALTSLLIFLAFFVAFISMARQMGNKFREAMSVLIKEDTQQKRLSQLLDREVGGITNKIQAYSDCDRVLLFQFHNGEYYKSGQCRERASVSNEATKNNGISLVESDLQDIPKSRFKRELNLLNRYKLLCVDRKEETITAGSSQERLDISWRDCLFNIGVVFTYDISVVVNSEIIGILSIQYLHEGQTESEYFEQNYDLIMNLVAQLEATLANH